MAFRYLNVANSWGSGLDARTKLRLSKLCISTRDRLLKAIGAGEAPLSKQEAARAYVIIVMEFLSEVAPIDRREMTWALAKHLPRRFFGVISDIARNCG